MSHIIIDDTILLIQKIGNYTLNMQSYNNLHTLGENYLFILNYLEKAL